MKFILITAGFYNIVWGSFNIIFPDFYFDFAGMQKLNYPEIWQCLAMIVGAYGLAYIIASFNPYKHWPVIMAGFIGKVLGPIGFLLAYLGERFTLKAGITNITNDLIWWIPFTLILLKAYRFYHPANKKT
jgi:hypothetical protein